MEISHEPKVQNNPLIVIYAYPIDVYIYNKLILCGNILFIIGFDGICE